jgi:FHS family Na+ dependent glucose MFS transporter 1
MLALGFGTAVIGPTLPVLAQQTHTPIGSLGIVFTTTSVGYLFGALRSGRWFDHLPGHRVLAVALLLVAAAFAMVPLSGSLLTLAMTFLVLGAATATIDVGTNTLLLWRYRDRVGAVMNGLHFCFGAGALVAPAIVAWSIRVSDDVSLAYWTLGAVTLGIATGVAAIPGAPQPVRAAPQGAPAPQRRLIAIIAVVFACYVAVEVTYGGWISTYGVARGFGDAATTAYLASTFWGTLTLGRLIAIPLANRFRSTTIIAVDFGGALLCLAAVLLMPQSGTTLWIATGLFGFCLASIFPTLLVFSGERMPVSGQSTSWYIAAAGIGSMTLPWFVGHAFESFGVASLLWLEAIVVGLAAGAFRLAALQPRLAPASVELTP